MGAVAKHRAGDIEQPIADRAEGTYLAVTAEAQSGVLGAAARIVLHGNASQVVEGILEPRITRETSRDDAALSGTLGDRSSATKSPQGAIVSSLEGFPSLCEQRGEDDPTVSWQGGEDRSVALLVYLSRFALRRLGQEAAQPVELAMRILELTVDHSQTFAEHSNMSACRLDRFRGDGHWWPFDSNDGVTPSSPVPYRHNDCIRLDIREVKPPIVCFCSHGDNITPPQQALD